MDESRTLELVRLAQGGDREAFGLLVEEYERTVHAIVFRRLRNTAEAAEVTQDVFVQMLRKIGQLREPERFVGGSSGSRSGCRSTGLSVDRASRTEKRTRSVRRGSPRRSRSRDPAERAGRSGAVGAVEAPGDGPADDGGVLLRRSVAAGNGGRFPKPGGNNQASSAHRAEPLKDQLMKLARRADRAPRPARGMR